MKKSKSLPVVYERLERRRVDCDPKEIKNEAGADVIFFGVAKKYAT